MPENLIIVSDGTEWGSEEWYQARWDSVPQETKDRILFHLRKLSPKILADLKAATSDPWFHLGAGMGLRNYLREEVSDEELPDAPYPTEFEVRNWDDYYKQALEAA